MRRYTYAAELDRPIETSVIAELLSPDAVGASQYLMRVSYSQVDTCASPA
ncbi:hypothetical protein ACL02S_02140 [Nocardia sp. 004]